MLGHSCRADPVVTRPSPTQALTVTLITIPQAGSQPQPEPSYAWPLQPMDARDPVNAWHPIGAWHLRPAAQPPRQGVDSGRGSGLCHTRGTTPEGFLGGTVRGAGRRGVGEQLGYGAGSQVGLSAKRLGVGSFSGKCGTISACTPTLPVGLNLLNLEMPLHRHTCLLRRGRTLPSRTACESTVE